MTGSWADWSGQQHCRPVRQERPADEAALVEVVQRAAADGLVLRPVGSSHSFGGLCVTDGVQVDLSRLDRVLGLDPATGVARVQAGITPARPVTGAARAGPGAAEPGGHRPADPRRRAVHRHARHRRGLRQPLSQMVGGRLVTADGAVHELADPDDPLAPTCCGPRASRWGRWECCPRSRCRPCRRSGCASASSRAGSPTCSTGLDELVAGHDHVEFYAVPYSRRALVLTSQRTDEPADPPPAWRTWLTDDLLANRALDLLQRTGRRVPRSQPGLGPADRRPAQRQHPARPQPPGVRHRAPGPVHRVGVGAAAGRRAGGRRGRDRGWSSERGCRSRSPSRCASPRATTRCSRRRTAGDRLRRGAPVRRVGLAAVLPGGRGGHARPRRPAALGQAARGPALRCWRRATRSGRGSPSCGAGSTPTASSSTTTWRAPSVCRSRPAVRG